MSKFRKETDLLLRSLQSGNNCNWEELYLHTFNHIKGLALKYLIDKTVWKEVVNQTYIRVLRQIETLADFNDGYDFMRETVQNVELEFNGNREFCEPEDKVFAYLSQLGSDLGGFYFQLSLLSLEDQNIIWLRFWEELSCSEIAKLMGSTKSSIRKRIKLILKNVKS